MCIFTSVYAYISICMCMYIYIYVSLDIYIYTCTHATAAPAKSLQSGLTLCDPMDYSLPDSSVHGISQARIPAWVAMLSSRGPY